MQTRDAAILGGTLGFVAGFADASTFVGADGVFCAHVTGNVVVLAADLALRAPADEWVKVATFPIFVSAVLCATWIHRRFDARWSEKTVRRLLLVKALLIGAAAAIGMVTAARLPGAPRIAIVGLLVFAMGIQNALHRLTPTTLGPMTTVMTGNVTQWLTESIRAPASADSDRAKHRLLAVVIAGFAGGCAAGALGVTRFGFGALVVPAVVVLVARSRIP